MKVNGILHTQTSFNPEREAPDIMVKRKKKVNPFYESQSFYWQSYLGSL